MKDPLVEEIKSIYKVALNEAKEAEGKVRGLAFNIGKVRGFLLAKKIIEEIVKKEMESIERKSMAMLEAKKAYFDSLQEKTTEDYEKFSREVEQITRSSREKMELLSSILIEIDRAFEEEKEKIMESIRRSEDGDL